MEEKNNKKGKLLYTLLGIALLLTLVGGAYAFFSASVSNNNIGGNTQNINNDSLTLTVKKVVFTGATAPSNDLVPAWFGYSSGTTLNNDDPSDLTEAQVGTMLTNKCVSDGFTGCHVYQIKIHANQNITHANLLLNLSVGNLTGASNVVDKSQWGYVVFSANGTVDSSTGATDGLSNPDFNDNNGAPAAIGDGVTNLDIHNDSSLSTTDVIYYLLVYVNDTGESQNSVSSNTGDENYAVGTYSGSLELQALGGKVRTDFGPQIETAAQTITNLYVNAANTTTATVHGITYNLAPIFDNGDHRGGLMDDGHGPASSSTPASGISYNLVSDTDKAKATMIDNTNTVVGNIRYYGDNPDNYVWLGDTYTSEYSYVYYHLGLVESSEAPGVFDEVEIDNITRNIGDKKLWRIIGVFDGKLKLIQVDPIYSDWLPWDTSHYNVNGGYGINQWGPSPADGSGYKGADLMKLLNPGHDNNEDLDENGDTITVNNSLYWNKGTGTVYTGNENKTTSNVSFANTGLSPVERSMIDTVTWYLGAVTSGVSSFYVDNVYNAERQSGILGNYYCSSVCDDVTRTATWTGKVGLMYLSDYGYAADLRVSSSLSSRDISFHNWLYDGTLGNGTMTPNSYAGTGRSSEVFQADMDGYEKSYDAAYGGRVRPVIYLKPGVTISSGSGREADPYVLSLS